MTDRDPGAARGIASAAALLAGSVLLSRVLGYAREVVLANQLGVSAEVDAYRAAFQLPDLLNHFLAGGALSIAFIPLYAGIRAREGPEAAQRFFGRILGTLGAAAVVATAGLWIFAEPLVSALFGVGGGFDDAQRELTVRLTRIVLPAQICFIAGGIVRGALMAHGRFFSQALAPLLYNAGIIAGGLLLAESRGAEGFAWGALAGAVAGPLVASLVEARRAPELRLRPVVALRDRELARYLFVAAPLMVGVTLLTMDEWYDRLFGARLAEGTISLLFYARYLMLVPVAVLGQAVATAALPTLSRLWSAGRRDELDRQLQATLRVAAGLAMLGAAAFYAFAGPLVEILYRHGEFTSQDAARCADLLRIFAWAVPGWVVQQIAVRAFYARGDTWRPMLLGTAVALLAVPLYWGLGQRLGAPGLAWSGVAAVSANALGTLALARRLHGAPSLGALGATAARALAIALVAGGLAAWATPRGEGAWAALGELALGGALFAVLAAALGYAFGDEALREGLGRLARRAARLVR